MFNTKLMTRRKLLLKIYQNFSYEKKITDKMFNKIPQRNIYVLRRHWTFYPNRENCQ